MCGHTETVFLLNHNADINKLDIRGNTPLTISIINYQNEISKVLISNSANVNERGDHEFASTPLVEACRMGLTKIVNQL